MNTPDPLSFKCLFCNKTTTGDHSAYYDLRYCNCNEFDIVYCFPNKYELSWYSITPSKQNYKYYAIVFMEYDMLDQNEKLASGKIVIYDNNHDPILILPKFNLTPLNFYDKLKIYLTFS